MPSPCSMAFPRQISQLSGVLACPHCPFRSNFQPSLSYHKKHHSIKSKYQCPKCSYSMKHEPHLAMHIKRVHTILPTLNLPLERCRQSTQKKRRTCARKGNSVESMETNDEEEAPLENCHESIQKKPRTSGRKKNSIEPMETNGEEDDVNCLCDNPNGKGLLICCDECEDWFHGQCVGVTPALAKGLDSTGYEWICVRCVEKESPMYHRSKVFKAMTGFAQQLDLTPPKSPDEEEKNYRKKLVELAKEFQATHLNLLQTAKIKKEEAQQMRKSRIANAADLHQTMEELEKVKRELSVELTDLEEQKERILQQLKEKTSQKILAGLELSKLRDIVSRVKQEQFNLRAPDAAVKEYEEPLLEKEKLHFSLEKKIKELIQEETDLNDRIKSLEGKLSEIGQKMQSNSGPLPEAESVVAAQMRTLKEEQEKRICSITKYERKLIQFNCQKALDGIGRKGKEWLADLMDN